MAKIGFAFSNLQMVVSSVTDPIHADMKLTWRPEERVTRFTAPEGVRDLAEDDESGQPVALAGSFGAGHYVYLATHLDPYTNEGTSHYPYFPEYLSTTFGATTSLRSRHIEVYFDPDNRPGADLNRLATIWHRAGISTVHVAAWKFCDTVFLSLRRLCPGLPSQRHYRLRLVCVPHGDSEDVG